jgi:hypothetical protein
MDDGALSGPCFMKIIKPFVYTLLFVAFLLPHLLSFAAVPTPDDKQPEIEKIEEQDYFLIFRKLFFSTTYNSLKCQDNIYILLEDINTRKKNL